MKQTVSFILSALGTTGANIKSNRQTFFVSIATITIAWSIFGLFLLIFVNLNSFLATWNEQVQLVVYVEDDIREKKSEALEIIFQQNPSLESFSFVSREEAWKEFKERFSDTSEVIQGLDFNPLPGSYHLSFKEVPDRLGKIREFATLLKQQAGVESVDYGESWIGGLEKFMIFIRIFLVAIGGLLCLGLILIISNTIKLSYYSRREEIELMQMIGATHRAIKTPFFLEGMLEGFFGALLALAFMKVIHSYIQYQIDQSLGFMQRGMEFHFISNGMVLALVFFGVLVGWMGSSHSIRQFFKTGEGR